MDPREMCKGCGRTSSLVLQVYAPAEGSADHRALYVTVCVACPAADETDVWAAGRAQFPDPVAVAAAAEKSKPVQPKNTVFSTSDWGVNAADDWGDAEDDGGWGAPPKATAAAPMPVEAGTADALVQTAEGVPQLPKPVLGEDHPGRFVCHYLNVVAEPAAQPKLAGDYTHEDHLLKRYVEEGGVVPKAAVDAEAAAGDGEKDAKEIYEKVTPKHGDLAFHRFQKRVGRLPTQCLRYSVGGAPLAVSDRAEPQFPAPESVPPCADCGASRQCEIQLLPAFLNHLALAMPGIGEVPSFGTVLVFTCSRHCRGDRPPGAIQPEWVFVQADPDDAILKAVGVAP